MSDPTAWILGLFMCKAVSYLQGVAVSASINTLVAVSADRYVVFSRICNRHPISLSHFLLHFLFARLCIPRRCDSRSLCTLP